MPLDSRRKYWGAYCPVPQAHDPYVHVVYPVGEGYVLEDDGTTRPLTPAELDERVQTLQGVFADSFLA